MCARVVGVERSNTVNDKGMELGILCVNDRCFHRPHPDRSCTVSYDGGPGRSSNCVCKENKQLSKYDENILIIKRNLPRWEHYRLRELLNER